MREKVMASGLTSVYKTQEAIAMALTLLATVEKIRPGYGISTKNHSAVKKVVRKLTAAEKQLRKVARKWMQ